MTKLKNTKEQSEGADHSKDSCFYYKQFLLLENHLRTKSDECSSLKSIIPFSYNYKEQTKIRANYFQR